MSDLSIDMYDPIHQKNGFWYFYSETWADEYGPYRSKEEAVEGMKRYAEEYQRMRNQFEVYEEDKHGNTWLVAKFSTREAAEMYRKRLYPEDPAYKVREVE